MDVEVHTVWFLSIDDSEIEIATRALDRDGPGTLRVDNRSHPALPFTTCLTDLIRREVRGVWLHREQFLELRVEGSCLVGHRFVCEEIGINMHMTSVPGREGDCFRPGDHAPYGSLIARTGGSSDRDKVGVMRGDIILVGEEHRAAAERIVDQLIGEVLALERRYTVTVAGESGSGKSETGQALAEAFTSRDSAAVVLQQDDYYVLPPRFNDAARRANFEWVGTTEVRLDLLDSHLEAARNGAGGITKPLVVYEENRIDEEEISLENIEVVIAEGVYTSLCEHVDRRVFIARNRLETMEHRMRRGRENSDPFIEEVLKTEHEIISQHRSMADVVITRDYDVEFVTL